MIERHLTVDDFELERRGSISWWRAKKPLATPIGEFDLEFSMNQEDHDPPDDQMLQMMDQLVEQVKETPADIRERIYEHYKRDYYDKYWLRSCGVPAGLSRKGVMKHVESLVLNVRRRLGSPKPYDSGISIRPEWEPEHLVFLERHGAEWVFLEF
jgi:hypothetical protein